MIIITFFIDLSSFFIILRHLSNFCIIMSSLKKTICVCHNSWKHYILCKSYNWFTYFIKKETIWQFAKKVIYCACKYGCEKEICRFFPLLREGAVGASSCNDSAYHHFWAAFLNTSREGRVRPLSRQRAAVFSLQAGWNRGIFSHPWVSSGVILF